MNGTLASFLWTYTNLFRSKRKISSCQEFSGSGVNSSPHDFLCNNIGFNIICAHFTGKNKHTFFSLENIKPKNILCPQKCSLSLDKWEFFVKYSRWSYSTEDCSNIALLLLLHTHTQRDFQQSTRFLTSVRADLSSDKDFDLLIKCKVRYYCIQTCFQHVLKAFFLQHL